MEKTTATALVIEAIRTFKEKHDIPSWEDSLIQIAEPGEDLYEEWREVASMQGDPDHAEIALYQEGFGQFYTCVEAAIEDIWQYFDADLSQPEG